MLKHSIDRAKFVKIVERALGEATRQGLPARDVERIKATAAKVPRAAFGDNVVKHCGCPLIKAGFRPSGMYRDWPMDRDEFAGSYDAGIRVALALDSFAQGIVEIVG